MRRLKPSRFDFESRIGRLEGCHLRRNFPSPRRSGPVSFHRATWKHAGSPLSGCKQTDLPAPQSSLGHASAESRSPPTQETNDGIRDAGKKPQANHRWPMKTNLKRNPSHLLMLHTKRTATRCGTSLVPGFGTETVPKIGPAFWKAICFRRFFSTSLL